MPQNDIHKNNLTAKTRYMKSKNGIILVCCILLFAGVTNAQTLAPKVMFKDTPQTHNMHITSDGQYLYTCNGGKPELGQISKFSLNGTKIASYKIELDMRSVIYNGLDKKLYVNGYDKNLYRIEDLMLGVFSKVLEFTETNEQSSPAISTNGKLIYFLDNGNVSVYTMKNGKLKTTFSGIMCSEESSGGGAAIAVDDKRMYSWDGAEQEVYVYDLKGKYQKTLELEQGDYGFSLSFANGMLWVSTDGNYEEGTWYGYAVE